MRPNHTGNNHPHDSTGAVMRLLVKIQSRNSSEARKWQSWMKSVGNCACPKSEDESEKKFGLGTCRFRFPDTSQIKVMAIEIVNTWWNKLGQWSSLLANHQPSLVFFHDFFPLNLALKGELRSAYLFKMKSWIEVFGQEESWIWLLGELCR